MQILLVVISKTPTLVQFFHVDTAFLPCWKNLFLLEKMQLFGDNKNAEKTLSNTLVGLLLGPIRMTAWLRGNKGGLTSSNYVIEATFL